MVSRIIGENFMHPYVRGGNIHMFVTRVSPEEGEDRNVNPTTRPWDPLLVFIEIMRSLVILRWKMNVKRYKWNILLLVTIVESSLNNVMLAPNKMIILYKTVKWKYRIWLECKINKKRPRNILNNE